VASWFRIAPKFIRSLEVEAVPLSCQEYEKIL
jgi:hypothetical protein